MAVLSIGDPVEVRFVDRHVGEVWVPATVVTIESDSIGVAFSDHQRMMVRRGEYRASLALFGDGAGKGRG